jgi:hypothetical protein
MKLVEHIAQWSREKLSKIGRHKAFEPWETRAALEVDVEAGRRSLEYISSPVSEDHDRARGQLRALLLEKFVDNSVKNWDEFLLLKGTVLGLDKVAELPGQMARAGIEAEKRLEPEGKKNDRRS